MRPVRGARPYGRILMPWGRSAFHRSCLLVPALHLIPHGLGTFSKASIVCLCDTLVVGYDDPMPNFTRYSSSDHAGLEVSFVRGSLPQSRRSCS